MAFKKMSKEEYLEQQREKLDTFMLNRENAIIDSIANLDEKLPLWEAPVFHSKCINPASNVRYRVENTASLGDQMYQRNNRNEMDKEHEYAGMPFFMTYSQAKNNGLTVKKGSKSYVISKAFGKKIGERESTNDTGDKITEDIFARRMTLDNVFHISDLDGEINERLKRNMNISFQKPDHVETKNILEALIESAPVPVDRVSFFRVSSGSFYTQNHDKINVPPSAMFKNDLEEFSTIAHEISHAWGIPSRHNRESLALYHTNDRYRAEEELVANVSAQAVVSHFNLDMDANDRVEAFSRNHDSYDFGWARVLVDDREAITRAIRAADKVAGQIISDVEHKLAMKLTMNPEMAIPDFLKERIQAKIEKGDEKEYDPAEPTPEKAKRPVKKRKI